jgi:hypothetical protein
MTTAAMVTYAYDQIDEARTELNAVSKQTTSETNRPPSCTLVNSQVVASRKFVSDTYQTLRAPPASRDGPMSG